MDRERNRRKSKGRQDMLNGVSLVAGSNCRLDPRYVHRNKKSCFVIITQGVLVPVLVPNFQEASLTGI